MKIYCATSNAGKLAEFRRAAERLQNPAIDIEPLPSMASIKPCEETGPTFEENAVLKAEYYSAGAGRLVFAEDSGLEVNALGGQPGICSARWSGPAASDASNNQLLLERLSDSRDRSARYVCVAALARDGRVIETFRGEAEGHILEQPRGQAGFGYDPLFFYPPLALTFAELDMDAKFQVSHRGRAFRALLDYVQSGPLQESE